MKYLFVEIDEHGFYDINKAVEDPIKAIELYMKGAKLAALDAVSHEFYGYV